MLLLKFLDQILKKFLNIYWIRPETAFWRSLDVLQMKSIDFKRPIIDIGCGDGTFSFTHFEGELASNYDVYRTINTTNKFFEGHDIHDQKNSIKPRIIQKAKTQIDVGLDWKKNLLDKAKKLKLYEKLIQHDSNKKFPFKEREYGGAWDTVRRADGSVVRP